MRMTVAHRREIVLFSVLNSVVIIVYTAELDLRLDDVVFLAT